MMIRTFEPMIVGASVRWIDLAAFAAMALLWLGVAAMLYAIYRILRGKARGDHRWDEPGL
jgi:hypothetical protein